MVTILTPTRNRPEAFDLLQQWVERQTYRGRLQWIVVNDGTALYNYRLNQSIVHRKAKPDDMHSMCMNLLAGLPLVEGSKLLILEDDDYLAPEYIEKVCDWLDKADMAGSCPAIYYHLGRRMWRNMGNKDHASLGQTGFRKSLVPWLSSVIQQGTTSVDLNLWSNCPAEKFLHRTASEGRALHLGMKGLPGEPGIGVGHRMKNGVTDRNFGQLQKWIGKKSAQRYISMISRRS